MLCSVVSILAEFLCAGLWGHGEPPAETGTGLCVSQTVLRPGATHGVLNFPNCSASDESSADADRGPGAFWAPWSQVPSEQQGWSCMS